MEEEMLVKINSLGIGPGGLGGTTTALAVNINTHDAQLEKELRAERGQDTPEE
jgi:fumarate hydratase subunit alpha